MNLLKEKKDILRNKKYKLFKLHNKNYELINLF